MKNIIIVGAGGFAKELYGYITDELRRGLKTNAKVKGIIVDNQVDYESMSVAEPYLGKIEDYTCSKDDELLIAIGSNPGRDKVIKLLESKKAVFHTYIHYTAFVDISAKIGKGVILCPHSMVNAMADIGDHSVLNIFASVAHDAEIGRNSILSPYSTLNGFAKAGEMLFMGTNSAILPKVKTGNFCTISAGAVVSKPMKDKTLAFPSSRTTYRG